MLGPDLTDRIRHIFLHHRPHVSIMTAANLFGWTLRQMKAAIVAGEIETNVTPLATWVWREELVAEALELWSFDVIEEALGENAARVLPAALRAVLTRELEDVACAHADELSRTNGSAAPVPNLQIGGTWL